MRHTKGGALGYLEAASRGPAVWDYLCEKLQRSAWGVSPARYTSATKHFWSVPNKWRVGKPAEGEFVPGMLIIIRNSGAGHIVTVKDRRGNCWTNDYTGRGKVGVAHISKILPWCGAQDWYACDPWWGNPTEHMRMPRAARVVKPTIGRAQPRLGARRTSRREPGSVIMVTEVRRKAVSRRLWLRGQGGTWWRADKTNWKE